MVNIVTMLYKFINKLCLIINGPERRAVTSIQSCAGVLFDSVLQVRSTVKFVPISLPRAVVLEWCFRTAHNDVPIIKSSSSREIMRQLFNDILMCYGTVGVRK